MPKKVNSISFIVPTYRRPDVLVQCLKALNEMERASDLDVEIRVYDNGAPADSRDTVASVRSEIPVNYRLNKAGHGLGYSLSLGAAEATSDIIVELNDDALVGTDFLQRVLSIFESDESIGVIGVRAIEEEYQSSEASIGAIDAKTLEVRGNFDRPTAGVIDVEHVYGFCYAYRREILDRGAVHDSVLLAKDYSSGNRIETDQCLSARKLGYRVVYDGSIAVEHLAKPRPDLDETSLNWKLNHWRNTLYLYLKHYGLWGRNLIAIRFACSDLGLLSLFRKPTKTNLLYFLTALKARASALLHWLKHLLTRRTWRPLTR